MKELTSYNRVAGYLNKIFDLLNREFFECALTRPTITIQSTPKAYGHFSLNKDTWISKLGGTHEINIGAGTLARPIEKTKAVDFLTRGNLPVLVFALSRFAFSLVLELVDTVLYLIEYRGDYLPIEIITILVNYVHLFILLVVSYLIASLIKNKLIKDNDSEQPIEE